MTTSAACGRPVQQAALTDTMLEVPDLVDHHEADLAQQLDVVRAGRLADAEALGEVADAHGAATASVDSVCSSRTRVGSASTANHSA